MGTLGSRQGPHDTRGPQIQNIFIPVGGQGPHSIALPQGLYAVKTALNLLLENVSYLERHKYTD